MDIVTVRFTTKWPWNPVSPVIARLSGSKVWSHSMNIIGKEVFEATMLHGCRVTDQRTAMKGVVAYQDMYVAIPDVKAAVEFGHAMDGHGYDFPGALGIPLLASEDWNDDDRWWCSELNFKQLGVGGNWLLDPAEHTRVTPDHLRMCNFPKGQVVRLR